MVKTNKEYLSMSLGNLNVSDTDIDVILLKAGMDADAPADVAACDLAAYKRVSVVLASMTQNVSEGGYSISWNMDGVQRHLPGTWQRKRVGSETEDS